MPDKGEIFIIASDGKAKRVPVNDIPIQGRYGRGVVFWNLPKGVTLAGIATGKPNHIATIFLLKAAPKSTRLDAAPVRKRAAVRGETVVDVKAGDAVLSVVMGWEVENFVKLVEEKPAKKAPAKKTTTKKPVTKKPAARKKTAAQKTTTRKKTNK
jgi:DNA gyrase/topoisomerase IV subunit A